MTFFDELETIVQGSIRRIDGLIVRDIVPLLRIELLIKKEESGSVRKDEEEKVQRGTHHIVLRTSIMRIQPDRIDT
jgi:hypothetical protein